MRFIHTSSKFIFCFLRKTSADSEQLENKAKVSEKTELTRVSEYFEETFHRAPQLT